MLYIGSITSRAAFCPWSWYYNFGSTRWLLGNGVKRINRKEKICCFPHFFTVKLDTNYSWLPKSGRRAWFYYLQLWLRYHRIPSSVLLACKETQNFPFNWPVKLWKDQLTWFSSIYAIFVDHIILYLVPLTTTKMNVNKQLRNKGGIEITIGSDLWK